MPNDLRTFLLSQYTTPQNLQANPGLGEQFLQTYGGQNGSYLLEPRQSPGLRIQPEEDSFFALKNLGALALGVVDIGRGLLSVGANIANAITPGIELGNIPTGFGPASEALGVTPTPESLGEIPGALAEATTIPAIFRRSYELANDPSNPAVSSGFETAARFIGELTVSPLLDTLFNTGIDPARKNLPIEERFRALPGAVLAVVPAAKMLGAFKKALGVTGIIDITSSLESKTLIGRTDFGGIGFEKFNFEPGMAVSTPEGLGVIDQINKRGIYVNIEGKSFKIPKKDISVQMTEAQKIADGVTDLHAYLKETIEQTAGKNEATAKFFDFLKESPVLRDIYLGRLGKILTSEEAATLSTTDQALTVFDRAFDEATVASQIMKDSNGSMDVGVATAKAKAVKADLLEAIRASSTEGGQRLQFFSELDQFFKAADRMSGDPAKRLKALERDTQIHGLADWWEKVVNQAQLSSMVAQPVTAIRNLFSQFGRSIIQNIEQLQAETMIALRERGKLAVGKPVNPEWLTPDGNLDYSKVYAETLSTLSTTKDAIQDIPGRMLFFGKNAAEMADYHKKVLGRLVKGEPTGDIIKPEAYRGHMTWLDDVLFNFPKEASRLFNSPTGETTVAFFDTVSIANLAKSFKDLGKTVGDQGLFSQPAFKHFLVKNLPAMSQAGAGFMTTLNRFVELEQRRFFTAARLRANAARRGLSIADWTEQAMKPEKAPGGRPDWVAHDLIDSVNYGLNTTFGADPTGTFGSRIMQLYAAAPILKQAALPFPRFFFNRWAFISERNPSLLFGMLKKEFRNVMAGDVTKEMVVDSLRAKAAKQGKKFVEPSDAFIESKLNKLRQTAQVDAQRAFAQATLGAAALMFGETIRNSAIAGPKWNDIDIGEKDENGNTVYADVRAYDPILTIPLVIAEARKAINEGKDLFKDVFTSRDFFEIAAGLRRIDETGLAALDFPELAESKGTKEAVVDVLSKILGSNIGRFFTFLQTFKDAASLTDFRALGYEGSDELLVTDQASDPFIGPAIRSLPRGFQRALLGKDPPTAESPFRSEDLQTEYPLTRAMYGMNLTTKNRLEELVDSVNMNWSDVIGRQPTPEMSKLVARGLGNFFSNPVSQGVNMGDVITDRILLLESQARARGIKDPAVRRTALREAFAMARASVVPYVRAQVIQAAIESGNPSLIQQIFGPTFGRQTDELTRRAISGELNREF